MQMTKKVDGLGRIVIPKSYREQLNINTHDKIMICSMDEDIYAYKVHDKLMSIDNKILLGEFASIDDLGRLLLPKNSIRDVLNIHSGSLLSLEITTGCLLKITKLCPSCVLCGSNYDLYSFKNKYLCADCIDDINQLFDRTNPKIKLTR